MLNTVNNDTPWLLVLGTAQDGGYPQASCQQFCCQRAWQNPAIHRSPTCLAIIDPRSQKRWLIDCSQHFPSQLHRLNQHTAPSWGLSGIFLTHAHIGHYAGLINLGREVIATKHLPLYAMPRMSHFLLNNAPWNLLQIQEHIAIEDLCDQKEIFLTEDLSITPLQVPHRDELSETVGYRIDGPNKSALYITDIDGWSQWNIDLETLLSSVDIAWLDGTFYSPEELPHRNLDIISHPFVQESITRFAQFPQHIRQRIHFTHLNHSNPLCNPSSPQLTNIRSLDFQIAQENDYFSV